MIVPTFLHSAVEDSFTVNKNAWLQLFLLRVAHLGLGGKHFFTQCYIGFIFFPLNIKLHHLETAFALALSNI